MKKFFAIMLVFVLAFTVVSAAACNKAQVRVILYVTDDGSPIVRSHTVGEDDLPKVTNGDLVFDGWYYDKDFKLPFKNDDDISDGEILYAKWKQEQEVPSNKVTLTLNPNYAGAASTTFELDKNSTFHLTNAVRNGYTFDGWFTSGGLQWTDSMPISTDLTLYAHWTEKQQGGTDVPSPHTHNFGTNNYFMYVKCSTEGCNVMGRTPSTYSFREDFTYDFTDADKTETENMYSALVNNINAGSVSYDQIVSQYDEYNAQGTYIEYQYQVATVMFSVNYNDEWEQKATLISEVYNDWFKNYYILYGTINNSAYSDAFFANWSAEEKAEALKMAEIYSASENNLQTAADNCAAEYNNLLSNLQDTSQLPQLYEAYGKYVNANNAIAAQYGDKYANFMEYSYANDYNREYTPANVAVMREYVRTNIAPILIKLNNDLNNMQNFFDDNENFYEGMEDDYNFYEGLSMDSLFTLDEGYEENTYAATNLIGNYFKYLNNNQTGSKEINFFKHVNELFKNGNYYTASYGEEGAYTYYIPQKSASVLYFDDTYDWNYGYSYSTAFTFVHEFGHYYEGIYNGGLQLSMDHDETQSQGNEMLFLAWLKDNCPKGAEYGYKVLQAEQLLNILCTIVQSTIVDEFEQAVYSNTYGDGKFKDGIASADYGELYSAILDSYGTGMSDILGDQYWYYVVVDSSAYYISYAMSALPSLEIYVKAMSDGIDAARDVYFKLYTFNDYEDVVDADGDGEITYTEVLAYVGLDSPFVAAMYTNIANYFANFSV